MSKRADVTKGTLCDSAKPEEPLLAERSSSMSNDAKQALDDHARSIEDLHKKLAATPGADKERLNEVVAKYKVAHKQFEDDALGCMN
jgi:hypothetical protein